MYIAHYRQSAPYKYTLISIINEVRAVLRNEDEEVIKFLEWECEPDLFDLYNNWETR